MQVILFLNGKTEMTFVQEGFVEFEQRIKRYVSFDTLCFPTPKLAKSLPPDEQKAKEGEAMLKKLLPADFVVLLDEKGLCLGSVDFSSFLQKQMNKGLKRLVFVVGGPYGFSEEMYGRADAKLSLSPMTFSHQLIRLIFAEQLYRAFTILRGEPYHNV